MLKNSIFCSLKTNQLRYCVNYLFFYTSYVSFHQKYFIAN